MSGGFAAEGQDVRQKNEHCATGEMRDFIVSHVTGSAPEEPDEQFRRDLAVSTERLLERALFATGLGEPLSQVADELVELTAGRANLADVVHHLQAAAAPASAYIPPASQFGSLAAEIYSHHRLARETWRGSA
jgi:hypothetical protein